MPCRRTQNSFCTHTQKNMAILIITHCEWQHPWCGATHRPSEHVFLQPQWDGNGLRRRLVAYKWCFIHGSQDECDMTLIGGFSSCHTAPPAKTRPINTGVEFIKRAKWQLNCNKSNFDMVWSPVLALLHFTVVIMTPKGKLRRWDRS